MCSQAVNVGMGAGSELAKQKGSSTLISRNVTVAGHRTSVRLEPAMWEAFAEIVRREKVKLHVLCTRVARAKEEDTSLTAAIRVYIMNYFRAAATEEGHTKAGHGIGAQWYGDAGADGENQAPPLSNITSMAVMSKAPSQPYMMGGLRGTGSR